MNAIPSPDAKQAPLSERAMVAVWRHGLIPFFGLRGMNAPLGRVVERRYGSLPDEVMDVYAPSSSAAPRAPVVFVHGGGWVAGSKGRFYHRPLLALSDAGHPVYSLNYPRAPEAPFPKPLQSLLGALTILRRDFDVQHVHLAGDSAGGNLATMLGLLLENPELQRTIIGVSAPADSLPQLLSVASIYGVMDRVSLVEDGFPSARLFLRSYAGASALPEHTPPLPITPLDMPSVLAKAPTFIAAGTRDKLGRSSRLYAEHLGANGAPVSYRTYEGADHGFYCFPGAEGDTLRADVVQFFADVERSR